MELELLSPVGAEAVAFKWPWRYKEEIVETIQWACEDFPELKPLLADEAMAGPEADSYENVRNLCESFNNAVESLATSIRVSSYRTSNGLLKHIMRQVYERAVEEPEKLNQYEPFSPDVYGETSFELICQMIDEIHTTGDDVFVDLGSGVGQVVLQMAAATSCGLCIGIEKADLPSTYALSMGVNFRKLMAWYGKRYGKFELIKGNFFDDRFRERIVSASVIFVNNLMFGPAVDHRLKLMFAELKDGARIFSSKSYCPLNFRVSDRNLSDIGAIMNVFKMEPLPSSVSWTDKPIPYFHHIIDRTKLERHFEKMKTVRSRARSSAKRPEGSGMSLRSQTRSLDKSYEPPVYGVTTRNAWSALCSSVKQPCNNNDKINDTNNNKTGSCPKEPRRKHRSTTPTPPKLSPKKKIVENEGTEKRKPKKTPVRKSPRELKKKQIIPKISEPIPNPSPAPTISTPTAANAEERSRGTPPQLQKLLDSYRDQYLAMVEYMSGESFKAGVEKQIAQERERNRELKLNANRLEKQIKVLKRDGVDSLASRMAELGIAGVTPAHLFSEAQSAVARHGELQSLIASLEAQIATLEEKRSRLVQTRNAEIEAAAEQEGKTVPEFVYDKIAPAIRRNNEFTCQLNTLKAAISDLENEILKDSTIS